MMSLRNVITIKFVVFAIKKNKISDVITWRQNNKDLLSSLCRKIKNHSCKC